IREAGGAAEARQADITSEADQIALFDAAQAAFGRIDAVVANAGALAYGSMRLERMDADRLRRTVEINLVGTLITAREAARRLPDGGAIVIVSSMAARLGSPNEYIDYAVAKGGLDTL